RRQRHEYFHLIVTANGTVYRGRGLEPDAWKASVKVAVGRFDGGWAVEAAVSLAELGLKAGAIPKGQGLIIHRQTPGPAARVTGRRSSTCHNEPLWNLDQPSRYRLSDYTCWSPTYAEFSGWPFYSDSRPFHLTDRFGHAVLEVGTQDIAPPAKPFEVLFKADFDDGKIGPFQGATLTDDNFRGPGRSLTFAEGQNRIHFKQPLEDLDDVTILFTCKLAPQNLPVQHVSLTGLAPDGIWCGAERYEFFLPPEEAAPRTQFLEQYHTEKYGA